MNKKRKKRQEFIDQNTAFIALVSWSGQAQMMSDEIEKAKRYIVENIEDLRLINEDISKVKIQLNQ